MQVIELGQVGRAFDATTNSTQLFVHSQKPGAAWGDTSEVSRWCIYL